MLKKILAVSLAVLLVQVIFVKSAWADSKEEKQVKFVEKLKAGIAKLGVGEDARIEVKRRDKSKVAGYLSEVGDQSFVVTDLKTSNAMTVNYTDVVQAKGHNLSTNAKIAIGIGIGVAIALIVLAIYIHCCTG
jgi:hypothetical protein